MQQPNSYSIEQRLVASSRPLPRRLSLSPGRTIVW